MSGKSITETSGTPVTTPVLRDPVVLFFFLAGSIFMLLAARGNLWFDELWSLLIAHSTDSFPEVITKFKADNNHPLNTLYLRLIPLNAPFLLYRIPSLLSGIGSVWLMARIAHREQGIGAARFTTALMATSFPLILYFSEARGYALAMLCGILCFDLLRKHAFQPLSRMQIMLFRMAAVIGILSHLTFVFILVSLAIFMVMDIAQQSPQLRRKHWLDLARFFLVPALFFAGWYTFFAKDMDIGGGPEHSATATVCRAAAMLLGLSDQGYIPAAAFLMVLVIITVGTQFFRKQKSALQFFFPAVLILVPALFLLIKQPQYLYFRYFVVVFPFFYLLLGLLMGQLLTYHHLALHCLAVFCAALIAGGQVQRLLPLLTIGRGGYYQAIHFIADNDPAAVLRIGSDNDARNHMLLNYYLTRSGRTQKLDYLFKEEWQTGNVLPEWFIFHCQNDPTPPPQQITPGPNLRYTLAGTFPSCPVSGFTWYLYRKTD